jgi:hypothetical protein
MLKLHTQQSHRRSFTFVATLSTMMHARLHKSFPPNTLHPSVFKVALGQLKDGVTLTDIQEPTTRWSILVHMLTGRILQSITVIISW